MTSSFETFSKEYDNIAEEFGLEGDSELAELTKQYMFANDPDSLTHLKKTDHNTAVDYLRLSDMAATKKEALKYARKALSTDPDNIDAQVSAALYSSDSPERSIPKLKMLYEKNTEKMKENGYFEQDKIGKFWQIPSTRPYMRLLEEYSGTLYDCGMLRPAAAIMEEMLRLCKDDDLEARHTLMYIYAFLEDEERASELEKRYPYDNTVNRFLALSILYYKLGKLRKASGYLRRMRDINTDADTFFTCMKNGELYKQSDEADKVTVNSGTIDEFLEEAELHKNLFASVPSYFRWACERLSRSAR